MRSQMVQLNLKKHGSYFELVLVIILECLFLNKKARHHHTDVANRIGTKSVQENTMYHHTATHIVVYTFKHRNSWRIYTILLSILFLPLRGALPYACGQLHGRLDGALHDICDLYCVLHPAAYRAAAAVALLDAHGQTALFHEGLQSRVVVRGAHDHDPGVAVLPAHTAL